MHSPLCPFTSQSLPYPTGKPQLSSKPNRKRVVLYGTPNNLNELIETFAKHTIYDIVQVWDPQASLYKASSFAIQPQMPCAANTFGSINKPFDIILIAANEPTIYFEQLLNLGYLFEIAFDMLDLNTRFGIHPPKTCVKPMPIVVRPKNIKPLANNWFLDAWNLIHYWRRMHVDLNSSINPIREGTLFITLASNNHISQATVLIESILRFHPGSHILLCIADTLHEAIRYPNEKYSEVTLIKACDLKIPNFDHFSFQYARYEFCTSLKPYAMRYAIEKLGAKRVIFLDSDTLVCAPFEDIEQILDNYWAIFTPHIIEARSREDYMPEVCILNGGSINSGIVCLRDCPTTRSMLQWWCERLYKYGTSGNGLHGDQRWLDLLTGLYSGYYILKDIGYNVAHWNLCERTISLKDNKFWVNNSVPLRLFHYALINWQNPQQLFHMWASPEVEPYPELILLVNLYRMLVCQAYALKSSCKEPAWAYEFFDNGVAATNIIRKLYHGLSNNLQRFKQPYTTVGEDNYYTWLNARIADTTRITNLFLSILRLKEWEPCYPNLDGHQSLKLVMDILRINHVLKIPKEFFLPIAQPLLS